MVNCPLCHKETLDRKSFSFHLTKVHGGEIGSPLEKERLIVYTLFSPELVESTVKDYTQELFSLHKCPIDIKLYIKLLGLKRSHSEEKKTARYRDQLYQTLEKKYGQGVINVSQVPSIKEKIREAAREKYPDQKEAMLTGAEEFRKDPVRFREVCSKIQETCLERYGSINFGQGEEARAKARKSLRDFYDGLTYEELLARTSKAREAACKGNHFSSVEIKVRECFERLGLRPRYNVHMWHFNFDIVWGMNILEVQGDMWHANPLFYKEGDLILGQIPAEKLWEKDERKKKLAIEQGYSYYTVWESDIRACKTEEQLTEYIIGLINEQNSDR